MELGICSWATAGVCPKLHNTDNGHSRITSRTNVRDEWRRHAERRCRWLQRPVADVFPLPSISGQRRKFVITSASKSRWWKAEPLVQGSVTRRAMHIVKTLRSSRNLQADEVDAALQKWVISMQPNRKDWLRVLKEFDNKLERLLYFKISEWGLEQSWFEAGIRDYTKLMDKYGKEGNVIEAERTLRAMEERGISPDIGAYTVLIAAYGRAKMLARVREMFQELSLAGLELDSVFYKTVIVAYGSSGLLKEAEDVLTSMESAEVPGGVDAYVALLTAYGRLGQATDAQKIFDRMHLKGFRGDLRAFTALMEAYSNAKDYANAELIFQCLRVAGLKPDDRALASLMSVYARSNMLQRAAKVLVELEKVVGPVTLTSLIGWFGKAGLVEEAKQCFQELKRKGLPVSGKAYANMLAAYARAGEIGLADGVWVAIEEDGIALDDRACRVIVDGLLDGPYHEQGQKFFLSELQARGWEPPADLSVALAGHRDLVA